MIYDCFTFAAELDLLRFRLELLSPVVDIFVIVEATRTHSGLPKSLVFSDHATEFKSFESKIRHVIVRDLPAPVPDRWVPEHFQRNAITRGLGGVGDDDVVLITDVDEILDPAIVARLPSQLDRPTVLELRACYYRANWISPQPWPLARAVRARDLRSPQATRDFRPDAQIADAGAHFSYLMTEAEIAQKLRWFAHAEFDHDRERLGSYLRLLTGAGIFGPSGALLSAQAVGELNAVQTELHSRLPGWFDFEPLPRPIVRRFAQRYGRLRSRSWVPLTAVRAADPVVGGLVQMSRRREAR